MTVSQIKNTFNSIGRLDPAIPPSSLVLSLSITTDAIRYFILLHNHKQVVFFGNYQLHHVEDEADLANRLQKIYENDEALQLAYYKIFIGLDTAYMLVPDTITYLDDSAATIPLNQLLPNVGLGLHFTINPHLQFKIRSLFPAAETVHVNSSYLRLLTTLVESNKDKLFVNIHISYFDVIRFAENGTLQLMNRYDYKTQNDFIYFLLLCCEQLNINREKTALVLIGEVDIQSQIYKMCYRYFRYISFMQAPGEVQFVKEFDDYPKHLHFNLYTLGL